MKPFPSQTPSVFPLFTLLPIPRDDAKGEEFPIDGADNGAAKMQRPSCLFETIFRMREGWGGDAERRCLQLTAISQKREILYYLWYSIPPPPFSLSFYLGHVKRHEALPPNSSTRLSVIETFNPHPNISNFFR